MANPIYGDPGYEVQEIIGPKNINIDIIILDYKRFLEKVMFIGRGGRISLSKSKGENYLSIEIINKDTLQTSKILGEE